MALSKIAVLGVGAIGGTIASYLGGEPAHSVSLCLRSPIAELKVEGAEKTTVSVLPSSRSPADAQPVDWLLVATKAYDVASTAPWLERLVGPETRVAILQNGVEHIERFSPYVPTGQLVPVIVDLPVERLGPGHFHVRRCGGLLVASGPDGEAFAGLFSQSPIDVATTPDFLTEAWRKLAINCAGTVSAVLLKPAGISRNAPIAAVMRELVEECIAVARAEGAALDDSLVEAVVHRYQASAPDSINSLHADRLAGRPLEIDARNGAVVRIGEKHGIPTPANRIIVNLLEGVAP